MRGQQLNLWEDEKQIILEREKVDICTLKTLKTRTHAFSLLPPDTYYIYKTGGINPFMKELGPIFPFIKEDDIKEINTDNLSHIDIIEDFEKDCLINLNLQLSLLNLFQKLKADK